MDIVDFKNLLGFSKNISVFANISKLSESQAYVVEQVKNFGIDEVYFSTDNNQSYPAIFFKKVISFDDKTLNNIAAIHKNAWNYKKVLFLYVYNDVEIRIYNCAEKPFFITESTDIKKELKQIEIDETFSSDTKKIQKISQVFSSIAIDSGIIWTLQEESNDYRKKINLQHRVDKYLVDSLIRTAKYLEQDGLTDTEIINKLVMRSLFLLYLEDRGATNAEFYDIIKKGARTYFDILNDVDSTYRLFSELEKHFNGNVFFVKEGERDKVKQEHLDRIKRCFIYGDDGTNQAYLFDNWRIFNFQIIQIELLSEIYENFLSSMDSKRKKQTGTFYTPPSLVELILNERLPVKNELKYNVKILDPACGSGIFLVESFKRLVKRYENNIGRKLTDYETLKNILVHNIYGIEISYQAIIVAAFSLYLALLDNLNPKTLWQNKKLPYLINDPDNLPLEKQGNNLYRRDSIEYNKEIENIEFDLVIGNPPFGTEHKPKIILLDSIRRYCESNNFAKEMVLPFLHKAVKYAPHGQIAMIFNTKILTNTGSTYENFRRWLMQDCYVEKIYNFSILRNAPENFGGQLFGSAIGPICIAFYQKYPPTQKSNKIIYYAPKTYIKSNVLEGVVIDRSDVKYLPIEECQKPDSKIWKITMWGTKQDINVIKNASSSFHSVEEFFEENYIQYGVGFELSSPANKYNDKIKELPIHSPHNIDKYITVKPEKSLKTNKFRRLGKLDIYQQNHIILNEGIKTYNGQSSIFASFINYKSAYTKGIIGISSKKGNDSILKVLTLFFNSSFFKYYAFLTTSSWGIERDVIKYNELFKIPYLLYNITQEELKHFLFLFDKIVRYKKEMKDISPIVDNIDELILSKLSFYDRIVVKDSLSNLDLFNKQCESKALYPILDLGTKDYAEMISFELNNFIEGQGLFANSVVYNIDRFSPLAMVKIYFSDTGHDVIFSKEDVNKELKKIDNNLWIQKAGSIYFRKKLNYYDNNEIYLIRPNQRRFWTQTMAMEDASDLILEILNKNNNGGNF